MEEVVVQLDHFQCGLNFPLSKFLLEVLKFYRIQLIHLTPNSVLFLAIVVHLCEAFLGTMPNLALLRYFFILKKTLKNKLLVACSYCLQLRNKKLKEYIDVPLCDSCGSPSAWSAITGRGPTELKFRNVAAAPFEFWGTTPEAGDYLSVMTAAIADLKSRGLIGVHVVGDFIRRRLSSLKARKDPA